MKLNKINLKKEIIDYAKVIIIAILIAYGLNHYIIANATVPTGSMESTVMPGDRLIINRLAYVNSKPERGDIVCFIFPDDGTSKYLKRIIGLPGETIQGIDGIVYIDGEPLENDYSDQLLEYNFGPYEIPEDSYFMMGDNRGNSYDSRCWENKFVSFDAIIGKAVCSYYPDPRILE